MTSGRFTRRTSPSIPGISDSVRVSAGDLLFISGAVGFDENGNAPRDFAHGVDLVFAELKRALGDAGATFSDLVRINVYITELSPDRLATFRTVRDRWIDPGNVPASTVIGVANLFTDQVGIEIDAIAAV